MNEKQSMTKISKKGTIIATITGLLLIVLGVLFYVGSNYVYTIEWGSSDKYVSAAAIVKGTEYPEDDDDSSPAYLIVSFEYERKKYDDVKIKLNSTTRFSSGDTTEVYFYPGNPYAAKVRLNNESPLFLYIFTGLGIIIISASILDYLYKKKSNSKTDFSVVDY